MIKDLQHIVTLYLDPISYSKLQWYKPQKYNKLREIKESYKSCIIDIMRQKIIKTGIQLKTEIILLYNENMEYKIANHKVINMIQNWCTEMTVNLLDEYSTVDLKIFRYLAIRVDVLDTPALTYELLQDKVSLNSPVIQYADSMYINYTKDNKSMCRLVYYFYHIKKCIIQKDFHLVKSFIDSMPEYSNDSSGIKKIFTDNFITLLGIDFNNAENKNSKHQFIKITYNLLENLDINDQRLGEYAQISNKYLNTHMFQFNSYNPGLWETSNSGNILISRTPAEILQALNDILETADQFMRIHNSYKDMIST